MTLAKMRITGAVTPHTAKEKKRKKKKKERKKYASQPSGHRRSLAEPEGGLTNSKTLKSKDLTVKLPS